MDGLGAALIAATGASPAADKPQNTEKAQNSEDTGPDEARIRLQFTSPTKPALITGSAGPGDESAPDYRYLVVPLRALAST